MNISKNEQSNKLNQSSQSVKMKSKYPLKYICVYNLGEDKYLLDATYDYIENKRMHRDGGGGSITNMNPCHYFVEHIEFNNENEMNNFVNYYKTKYGSNNIIFRY